MEQKEIAIIENSVAKYFDAQLPESSKNCSTSEQLFGRIKSVLEFLLRTNQDRLWQGLYRIDVPENKVRQAFAAGSLNEIAEALAILIIEREYQKAKIREKYKIQ